MKRLFYYLLAASAVVLAAETLRAQGTPPTLDLAKAIDNTKIFDIADIAAGIAFTPLETAGRESLIGSPWDIAESKNTWYVHEGGKPTKLFDRKGQFISTVGTIGRGPDELLTITGIASDWERDKLYLWGYQGALRILVYSATGRVIARRDSDSHPDQTMGRAIFRNDKLVMWKMRSQSAANPKPGAKSILLEVLSSDLKSAGNVEAVDRNVVPVLYQHDGGYSAFRQGILSDNGKQVLVYETLDDTVFYCNADMTLSPAYTLSLGRYTPPAQTFGSNASVPWNTNFRLVNNMWEGDRFVIVKTMLYDLSTGRRDMKEEYLIFDRIAGSVNFGGFSAAKADRKPGMSCGGVTFTPMYIRNNQLVGYMQALDIVDNSSRITNPALKQLASKIKEDSNPVVVVVQLKN